MGGRKCVRATTIVQQSFLVQCVCMKLPKGAFNGPRAHCWERKEIKKTVNKPGKEVIKLDQTVTDTPDPNISVSRGTFSHVKYKYDN